jgi:hypothetical protein
MKTLDFEPITLRIEVSHRGGGIEIDLSDFGKKYIGHKMTAYQNYLGGGMLGAIGNDCTYPNWRDNRNLVKIAENLAMYFHDFTNRSDDEWESATFEQNQRRPYRARAY